MEEIMRDIASIIEKFVGFEKYYYTQRNIDNKIIIVVYDKKRHNLNNFEVLVVKDNSVFLNGEEVFIA